MTVDLRSDPASELPTYHLPTPLASVLFSYRLSELISAGISLVRALDILGDLPAPYGEAAVVLKERAEQGEILSAAMAERPDLFSPFYRSMVRAGEIAGVLEETLARAADLMTKEWTLTQRNPDGASGIFLLNPSEKPLPETWEQLSSYQQKMTQLLFCESFGLLLSSGVPILRAMEHIGTLLPLAQQGQMQEARARVKIGDPLHAIRLGFLPRFAAALIAHGEEVGTLDSALDRAAQIVGHELECWRLRGEETTINSPRT